MAGFHALAKVLHSRLKTGGLLLGLDFDGTLAPIAGRPSRARMPAAARRALARLAGDRRISLAVVSGRALDDLIRMVGVDGIFYAGNHGLEARGPRLLWRHRSARASVRELSLVRGHLARDLAGLKGVLLEDKGLTISVHYRLASPKDAGTARRLVRAALRRSRAKLRLARGRKVFELRPKVPWDKGHALIGIANRIGGAQAIAFIGDDRTDEEGFRTLGRKAISVKVGPGPSRARFRLAGPRQVLALLNGL